MADIVERLRVWQDYEPAKMFGGEILKDTAEAAEKIERLRKALTSAPCPGGGYTGQPKDEYANVEACLKAGVCGCDLGAALS